MTQRHIFIGSSSGQKETAEKLSTFLKDSEVCCHLWNKDVFSPSEYTLESLLNQRILCQHAVLLLTADDLRDKDGTCTGIPRDNVVFEAGLFMGRFGKEHTYLVCPEKDRPKLPTDLDGFTYETYDDSEDLDSTLRRVAKKIRKCILTTEHPDPIRLVESFLTFTPPEPSMDLAELLTDRWGELFSGMLRLQGLGAWQVLRDLKSRLSEYFEFTGQYRLGVQFSKLYVSTMNNLQSPSQETRNELLWTRIKFEGYLSVLSGNHRLGRRILRDCEAQLREKKKISPEERRLLFYCCRYLGISHQRHRSGEEPKSWFDKAKEHMENHVDDEYRAELEARLLRNYGNLSFGNDDYEGAKASYESSRKQFMSIPDQEHVGICDLKIAEVLIRQLEDLRSRNVDDNALNSALKCLDDAEATFINIHWTEGQARVCEQFMKMQMLIANNVRGTERASKLLTARRHATQALRLFESTDDARGAVRVAKKLGELDWRLRKGKS